MKTDTLLNVNASLNEVFDLSNVYAFDFKKALSIYPNPTDKQPITLKATLINISYKLFNLLGEVVRNGIFKSIK